MLAGQTKREAIQKSLNEMASVELPELEAAGLSAAPRLACRSSASRAPA